MESVVFHGVGNIGLDSVKEPKIKDDTDAIIRLKITDVIETYKAFDRRAAGWIKVELKATSAAATA